MGGLHSVKVEDLEVGDKISMNGEIFILICKTEFDTGVFIHEDVILELADHATVEIYR